MAHSDTLRVQAQLDTPDVLEDIEVNLAVGVSDTFGGYLLDNDTLDVNVDFGDGSDVVQLTLDAQKNFAEISTRGNAVISGSEATSIAFLEDSSGDGRPDYVTGKANGEISYWASLSNGRFRSPIEITPADGELRHFGSLGDLDGDFVRLRTAVGEEHA